MTELTLETDIPAAEPADATPPRDEMLATFEARLNLLIAEAALEGVVIRTHESYPAPLEMGRRITYGKAFHTRARVPVPELYNPLVPYVVRVIGRHLYDRLWAGKFLTEKADVLDPSEAYGLCDVVIGLLGQETTEQFVEVLGEIIADLDGSVRAERGEPQLSREQWATAVTARAVAVLIPFVSADTDEGA